MRPFLLALSLLTSLLTLPAMAQEVVVNQYVTDASSERVVEVSSLDAGLWLHLAPVDRNGLVLGAPTPVCRAPCTERIAMGLYGASVSTSDSDPVAASGVINIRPRPQPSARLRRQQCHPHRRGPRDRPRHPLRDRRHHRGRCPSRVEQPHDAAHVDGHYRRHPLALLCRPRVHARRGRRPRRSVLSAPKSLARAAFCANNAPAGGMAEWSMAPVLKTGVAKATVGSNPTPSVEFPRSTR